MEGKRFVNFIVFLHVHGYTYVRTCVVVHVYRFVYPISSYVCLGVRICTYIIMYVMYL